VLCALAGGCGDDDAVGVVSETGGDGSTSEPTASTSDPSTATADASSSSTSETSTGGTSSSSSTAGSSGLETQTETETETDSDSGPEPDPNARFCPSGTCTLVVEDSEPFCDWWQPDRRIELNYDAALDVSVPVTLAPGFGVRRELSVSPGEFQFRVGRERPDLPALEGNRTYEIEFIHDLVEINFAVAGQALSSSGAGDTGYFLTETSAGDPSIGLNWYIQSPSSSPPLDLQLILATANRTVGSSSEFRFLDSAFAGDEAWHQHLIATGPDDDAVIHPAESSSTARVGLSCNLDIFSQRARYDIRTARGDVEFIIAMENDGGPSPFGWLTTTRPLAVQGQLDGLAFQVDDVDDLFFAPQYDPFFSDYIFPLLAVRFTAPVDGICGLYFGSNGGDPLGDRGYVAFELSCDDLAPVNPFDVTDFYGDYADP
jgi:hypothetical protein